MAPLSVSDDQLLATIVKLTQEQGATTVRQVAQEVGLASSATAWHRIQRLRERGLVESNPRQRGVRATSVGALMAQATPEVLDYHLQVTIDPSAVDPVSVALRPFK